MENDKFRKSIRWMDDTSFNFLFNAEIEKIVIPSSSIDSLHERTAFKISFEVGDVKVGTIDVNPEKSENGEWIVNFENESLSIQSSLKSDLAAVYQENIGKLVVRAHREGFDDKEPFEYTGSTSLKLHTLATAAAGKSIQKHFGLPLKKFSVEGAILHVLMTAQYLHEKLIDNGDAKSFDFQDNSRQIGNEVTPSRSVLKKISKYSSPNLILPAGALETDADFDDEDPNVQPDSSSDELDNIDLETELQLALERADEADRRIEELTNELQQVQMQANTSADEVSLLAAALDEMEARLHQQEERGEELQRQLEEEGKLRREREREVESMIMLQSQREPESGKGLGSKEEQETEVNKSREDEGSKETLISWIQGEDLSLERSKLQTNPTSSSSSEVIRQLTASLEDMKKSVSVSESRINSLAIQLIAKEEVVQSMRAELNSVTAKMNETEQAKKLALSTNEELKNKIKELEAVTGSPLARPSPSNSMTGDVIGDGVEWKDRNEIEGLRAQMVSLQVANKELETRKTETDDMIDLLRAQCAMLTSELQQSRAATTEAALWEETERELKVVLKEWERRANVAEARVKALEGQLGESVEENRRILMEREDLRRQWQLSDQAEGAETPLTSAEAKVAALNFELSARDLDISQLKEKLLKSEGVRQELQRQLGSSEDDISALEQKNSALVKELLVEKTAHNDISRDVRELNVKMAELTSLYDTVQSDHSSLKLLHASLLETEKSLRSELSSVEQESSRQLQGKNEDIIELNSQILRIHMTTDEFRKQLTTEKEVNSNLSTRLEERTKATNILEIQNSLLLTQLSEKEIELASVETRLCNAMVRLSESDVMRKEVVQARDEYSLKCDYYLGKIQELETQIRELEHDTSLYQGKSPSRSLLSSTASSTGPSSETSSPPSRRQNGYLSGSGVSNGVWSQSRISSRSPRTPKSSPNRALKQDGLVYSSRVVKPFQKGLGPIPFPRLGERQEETESERILMANIDLLETSLFEHRLLLEVEMEDRLKFEVEGTMDMMISHIVIFDLQETVQTMDKNLSKANTLNQNLQTSETRYKELLEDNLRTTHNLQDQVVELQILNKSTKDLYESLKSESQRAQSTLVETQAALTATAFALSSKDADLTGTRKKLAELETLNSHLKQQVNSLQKQITEYKSQLAAVTEELSIDRKTQELTSIERSLHERFLVEKIEKLELQLQETSARLLVTDYGDVKYKLLAAMEAEVSATTVTGELRRTTAALIEAQDKALVETKAELDAMMNNLAETTKLLDNERKKSAELSSAIEDLKSNIVSGDGKHKVHLGELQHQCMDLTSELSRVSQKLQQERTSQAARNAEWSQMERNLQEKIKENEEKIRCLEEKLKKSENIQQEVQKKYSKIRKEHEDMNVKLLNTIESDMMSKLQLEELQKTLVEVQESAQQRKDRLQVVEQDLEQELLRRKHFAVIIENTSEELVIYRNKCKTLASILYSKDQELQTLQSSVTEVVSELFCLDIGWLRDTEENHQIKSLAERLNNLTKPKDFLSQKREWSGIERSAQDRIDEVLEDIKTAEKRVIQLMDENGELHKRYLLTSMCEISGYNSITEIHSAFTSELELILEQTKHRDVLLVDLKTLLMRAQSIAVESKVDVEIVLNRLQHVEVQHQDHEDQGQQIRDLVARLNQASLELRESAREHQNATQELERRIAAAEKNEARLLEDNELLDKERWSAMVSETKVQAELADLRRTFNEQMELKAAELANDQISDMKVLLGIMTQELEENRVSVEVVANLETKLAEARRDISDLQHALISQNDEAEREIEDRERVIRTMNGHMLTFKATSGETSMQLKHKKQQLKEANLKITEMAKNLSESEIVVSNLVKDSIAKEEEILRLKRSLVDNSTLQSRFEVVSKRADDAEFKLREMLVNSNSPTKSSKEALRELHLQLEGVQNRLSKADEDLLQLRNENISLQVQLSKFQIENRYKIPSSSSGNHSSNNHSNNNHSNTHEDNIEEYSPSKSYLSKGQKGEQGDDHPITHSYQAVIKDLQHRISQADGEIIQLKIENSQLRIQQSKTQYQPQNSLMTSRGEDIVIPEEPEDNQDSRLTSSETCRGGGSPFRMFGVSVEDQQVCDTVERRLATQNSVRMQSNNLDSNALKRELNELEWAYRTVCVIRDSWKAKCVESNHWADQLLGQVNSLEEQLRIVTQELKVCQSDISTRTNYWGKLREDLETENIQLEGELQQLKKVNTELQQHLNNIDAAHDLNICKEKLRLLESELLRANIEIGRLQTINQELLVVIEQKTAQLAELGTPQNREISVPEETIQEASLRDELRQQLETLGSQLTEMKGKIQSKDDLIRDLNNRLSISSESDLKYQLTYLREELETTRKLLRERGIAIPAMEVIGSDDVDMKEGRGVQQV